MADSNADVVVLGMGVGGETVAESLAEAGMDVVGVEERLVGGECPYFACVPTKMMVRAGDALAEARRLPELAGTAEVRSEWRPVADRIRDEATTNWDDRIAVDRFTGKGGRFVRGRGRLIAPDQVSVGGDTFQARRGVVIATGTAPQLPPIPGLDEVAYWTNRDAVRVTEPPSSLLVLGAGAVGVEFAQAFARFGTAVTLVEAADRIVPAEEPEASDVVERTLDEDQISVRTGATVTRVTQQGDQIAVELEDAETLVADHLWVATGRRTELSELGVDVLGLDPSTKTPPVDDRLRRVGLAQIPSSARGWIHKAGNAGVVKLVEDTDRGVLVGATSVGPAGGEVLGALAVAVHAEVPTERLRQMIYAYPTFHRAIEDALSTMV